MKTTAYLGILEDKLARTIKSIHKYRKKEDKRHAKQLIKEAKETRQLLKEIQQLTNKHKMRTKKEIKERIQELESLNIPEEDSYLDEGDQSELITLYWVLGEDT